MGLYHGIYDVWWTMYIRGCYCLVMDLTPKRFPSNICLHHSPLGAGTEPFRPGPQGPPRQCSSRSISTADVLATASVSAQRPSRLSMEPASLDPIKGAVCCPDQLVRSLRRCGALEECFRHRIQPSGQRTCDCASRSRWRDNRTVFSCQRLVGGILTVGSNSLAISPACHALKGDKFAALKPLKWGVVRGAKDGVPGHCCLSNLQVQRPAEGELYM